MYYCESDGMFKMTKEEYDEYAKWSAKMINAERYVTN